MAVKKRHTCFIDNDLVDRMAAVRARTGLSQSTQVRRGIQLWLAAREWPAHAAGSGESQFPGRLLPPFLGLYPAADTEEL